MTLCNVFNITLENIVLWINFHELREEKLVVFIVGKLQRRDVFEEFFFCFRKQTFA